MELLNPHLPSLSKYWLAALQDHAHLTLPPEFASQLPPTGGTFFTIDAMDIIRPYYDANWSSLLHAAAIWLTMNTVVDTKPSKLSVVGLFSPPPGEGGSDDFHLVLGLAVQSLCFSSTLDQPLTLNDCLQSLKILVSSATVKQRLASNDKMASELLSVLHRVLLTCSNHAMHVLALQVSQLIGGSLTMKTDKEDDIMLSPAYSLLKVAACCLFRLIPGLESLQPHAHTPPLTNTPLTQDTLSLISHTLPLLVTVISLCSPQDSLSILPSTLHMLLSSLQFTSCVGGATATSAGLQALRDLCSGLKLQDREFGTKLIKIVRSALASVLEIKESSSVATYSRMDEETRLLVMAVFLLVSPEICPPCSQLFAGCAQLLSDCISGSGSKVHVLCSHACWCTIVVYFTYM